MHFELQRPGKTANDLLKSSQSVSTPKSPSFASFLQFLSLPFLPLPFLPPSEWLDPHWIPQRAVLHAEVLLT